MPDYQRSVMGLTAFVEDGAFKLVRVFALIESA